MLVQLPAPTHELSSAHQHLDHGATVHPGIAIERVRYDPDGGPVEVQAPVQVVASPLAAVRAVRVDILDSDVFAMKRDERIRALQHVDAGGRLQAVAALYRGGTTGFTITLRDGTRAEWRLRPVRHMALAPARSTDCEFPCARRMGKACS
ncbi:hypothetical protein [Streptomyces sp. Isolate_45]|uniref:hypothetical protein n=1 Tax=unclassified Streptomyces TaxID=2593676 RepID=UPI002481D5C8|nr:hypothetical protein [Streptomyces sp. Isolate_45]MDA5280570.1 hypothetical protein [Streptomyces sp. Isolate_45]